MAHKTSIFRPCPKVRKSLLRKSATDRPRYRLSCAILSWAPVGHARGRCGSSAPASQAWDSGPQPTTRLPIHAAVPLTSFQQSSFLLWVLMGIMFTWVTYIRFKSDWLRSRELATLHYVAMPRPHRLPSQQAEFLLNAAWLAIYTAIWF